MRDLLSVSSASASFRAILKRRHELHGAEQVKGSVQAAGEVPVAKVGVCGEHLVVGQHVRGHHGADGVVDRLVQVDGQGVFESAQDGALEPVDGVAHRLADLARGPKVPEVRVERLLPEAALVGAQRRDEEEGGERTDEAEEVGRG